MAESYRLSASDDAQSETTHTNKSPALGRTTSVSRPQPLPKPLDLPSPRTPPPHTTAPHASRPPEPIAPPSTSLQNREAEESEPRQWWIDWICGCRQRGDTQVCSPFCYMSSKRNILLLSLTCFTFTGWSYKPVRVILLLNVYYSPRRLPVVVGSSDSPTVALPSKRTTPQAVLLSARSIVYTFCFS